MSGYKLAFKKAFPCTIPVLTGYLFIGIAFGVMYAEKGYSAWWAVLMSVLVYAGSAQYLAVNFFVPGISFAQIIFMTLMVNVRHIFYGLTWLEKFHQMGKKRWYMIFGLTDETYSLLCSAKAPEGVDEDKFMFAIVLLDQSYWVAGSAIGGILKNVLTFNTEGIEFAMTALFVVIFTEQWMNVKNRIPAAIGVISALLCLQIFGSANFVFPTMILSVLALFITRKRLEGEEENHAA
ncbi:AzlC family ABC transporter permease [Muricomes intestini]|jgi:4-azaleucine resistance transporter AzlC|uniref:4-azaleucine resistance transporter AzlC n=3 Tax=Muricomes intestini TaxID=1796634 RepID=A0A4R3JZQ5_9FIRM|nr:AzlC family ABC transporter permease [Muricomes intestini]TCS74528.1 4-azaleucine resistance transporter AzlC [Muricomes intestini]HAX50329.1 branched-chain amino acid ABC transporter permease [Lachnospiraceae bacterium]HCR82027.1 branched-chain amino acid ABC transporter permease [Lachnospiraceae bacterium]